MAMCGKSFFFFFFFFLVLCHFARAGLAGSRDGWICFRFLVSWLLWMFDGAEDLWYCFLSDPSALFDRKWCFNLWL
ncbi:hypothetical protein IWX49DRAFT_361087 [Phyllosticta citricarpa]